MSRSLMKTVGGDHDQQRKGSVTSWDPVIKKASINPCASFKFDDDGLRRAHSDSQQASIGVVGVGVLLGRS